MQILLLAAGQGTRLEAVHDQAPKSMVAIQDSLYIDLQFKAFQKFDLSQITVVGGYEFDQLNAHLQSYQLNHLKVVQNKDFKWGNLVSLLSAENTLLNDDLVILNADHYYSLPSYQKIFSPLTYPVEVCFDTDRNLTNDDMKILKGEQGFQTFSKQLDCLDYGYVGITRIQKSFLPHYLAACHTTLNEAGTATHVEQVLNDLSEQGIEIHGVDLSGSWWTEIDTPEDYHKAQAIIRNQSYG